MIPLLVLVAPLLSWPPPSPSFCPIFIANVRTRFVNDDGIVVCWLLLLAGAAVKLAVSDDVVWGRKESED